MVSALSSLCLEPIIWGLLFVITSRLGNSRLNIFVFTAHTTHCRVLQQGPVLQGVSELRGDIIQPGVGGTTSCGCYPGGAIARCLCTVIYCSL